MLSLVSYQAFKSIKIHPERIAKADKNMLNNLDYGGIEFSASKKTLIENKGNICINVFCYKNNLLYPVFVSDQKFKNCMDFLMITN